MRGFWSLSAAVADPPSCACESLFACLLLDGFSPLRRGWISPTVSAAIQVATRSPMPALQLQTLIAPEAVTANDMNAIRPDQMAAQLPVRLTGKRSSR